MNVEVKIPIEGKNVGAMIGVGGRVIKAIMFESNTQNVVVREETDGTHVVCIKGTNEQVMLARKLVEDRLASLDSKPEETTGKKCFYGADCKRKNCAFEHPKFPPPAHSLKSRTDKKRNKNKLPQSEKKDEEEHDME